MIGRQNTMWIRGSVNLLSKVTPLLSEVRMFWTWFYHHPSPCYIIIPLQSIDIMSAINMIVSLRVDNNYDIKYLIMYMYYPSLELHGHLYYCISLYFYPTYINTILHYYDHLLLLDASVSLSTTIFLLLLSNARCFNDFSTIIIYSSHY